ncbi:MAG TPA: PQQ-binding-like beta-propeller repeat protein [Acidobacteriota bacterium]|nr:PQQ-binding-like beta-propeller repeat protein [Acidobacteriota bacterium]
MVTCIDLKSGKTIWVQTYPAPFNGNPAAAKMGDGPFATPVLHHGRLYTLSISGILSCFNANDGELMWQKSFGNLNTSTIFCGTAASPVVHDKNLIVQVGDDLRGSILSLDLATGQQSWKWEGSSVAYASPIIAEFDGVRQVIAHTNDAAVGIDANNGQLLWSMPFVETRWRENIVSPVQAGEILILSNGVQGITAIKIQKENGKWSIHKLWQNKDVPMYMSTPVIFGDYLFGMTDKRKGMFFCLKISNGQVLWTTKGNEGENAAILYSNDLLFFLSDDGTLKAIKNDPTKYQPIATYSVADSQTWAHPVIWENQILVKDGSNLLLWSII